MGFFEKIKKGLTKTRNAISGLFAGDYEVDDEFYDELEERLILADLGVDIASRAVEQLRKDAYEKMLTTPDRVRAGLADILTDILDVGSTELKLDSKPAMVLVIGVNGVGKTTTIGKLSHQLAGRISWRSGPTGPTWSSSGSTRGRTPPPWSTTASLPPRPGGWT